MSLGIHLYNTNRKDGLELILKVLEALERKGGVMTKHKLMMETQFNYNSPRWNQMAEKGFFTQELREGEIRSGQQWFVTITEKGKTILQLARELRQVLDSP